MESPGKNRFDEKIKFLERENRELKEMVRYLESCCEDWMKKNLNTLKELEKYASAEARS